MSDIVKRLRSEQNPGLALRQQAADALERLAAENAALRAAAGKVTCVVCEGSGEMEVYESLSSGVKLPNEPCPDCTDLRVLLGESHE